MPHAVNAEIETERLTLRRPSLDDFEEALEMWASPEVTRFVLKKPSTREDMWGRLLRYIGHWELLGYGFWVAREKGSGRFVGEVGLGDFRREIEPPLGDSKEAGWVLALHAQGKGYATEAMRAAIGWVEQRFGPERMVCIIDPRNAVSQRVAHKLGFRQFARGAYRDEVTLMFERPPAAR